MLIIIAIIIALCVYVFKHYNVTPHIPPATYKPPSNGIYPYFECEEINIATKKARKAYKNFVVIDFETTGLSSTYDKIVEIGAVKIHDGIITDTFSSLVNPEMDIPAGAINIHGISNRMVRRSPVIYEILPELIAFIGNYPIVAHNIDFDMTFLLKNAYDCGYKIDNAVINTLSLSRRIYPDLKNHKLETVANHLGIMKDQWHRSLSDAYATAEILLKSIDMLNNKDFQKAQERAAAKLAIK